MILVAECVCEDAAICPLHAVMFLQQHFQLPFRSIAETGLGCVSIHEAVYIERAARFI